MFQVQLGVEMDGNGVRSVQLKQFLHIDSPLLTLNCLFKAKQNKAGGSWKEQEFMSENEKELLRKACLGDGFRDIRTQLLVCYISVYVFVDF